MPFEYIVIKTEGEGVPLRGFKGIVLLIVKLVQECHVDQSMENLEP